MNHRFNRIGKVIAFVLVLSLVSELCIRGNMTMTYAKEAVTSAITANNTEQKADTETADQSSEEASSEDGKQTTSVKEDTNDKQTTESVASDTTTESTGTQDGSATTNDSASATTQQTTTSASASATTQDSKNISGIEVDTSKAVLTMQHQSDFTQEGLIVNLVYKDGSKVPIINYETKYGDKEVSQVTASMGKKTLQVTYQEKDKTYSAEYTVEVVPKTVQNVIQYAAAEENFSLSWDALEEVTGYQVIGYNETKQDWSTVIKGSVKTLTITENNTTIKKGNQNLAIEAGQEYEVRVRAFYKVSDKEIYYGELSPVIKAVTSPVKPELLQYKESTTDSVSITWQPVAGADGYEIYRKMAGESDYIFCNAVTLTSYTDNGLESGKTYYYKVRAYNDSRDFCGAYSDNIKTSTLPVATTVKVKAGDGRIRATWDKVSGVTGYKLYAKKTDETEYTEVATVEKSSTVTYTITGLANDTEYEVQVRAYRLLDTMTYLAPESSAKSATPVKVSATSKKAKLYKNKKAFQKSKTYKSLTWFKKYVKYNKSYVMPGMRNTNVGGFNSYNMCPQATTFAGKYLLMSAYDRAEEENSVIYVMSKSTRKLVTTLVLPDQYHVGGMAFDGTNLWISHGNSVAAIKYTTIASAASKKKAYANVDYASVVKVETAASYLAYHKGLLWVGVCYERGNQPLYSYTIGSKSGTPTLTVKDKKMMPSRVQGIAFLKDGSLVLSRSNLYIKGMPYYIAQLEYYKPTWSGKKIKALGKCINVCQQPTMNEGIAVNGKYLYVAYESPAFSTATYAMDRICAFPLSAVKKKKS